jgi:multidrug efflux pump subunit AcrA (membrane-fusion protein)
MRPVRIGPSTPDGVEVLAGLEEGERVVGAPPASMTDGTSVRAEGRP